MITRLSKLNGFKQILAGRDLANVFEDGHVYEFIKVDGMIIAKDLGEHAMIENFKTQTFTRIMMDGSYLLTEAEYEAQKAMKDDKG